ncbi:Fic family protein [Sanguibacter sp. HDW7]|uniref:Fic family protein n=1 Tax=Sanguibacter sp. HDW7 TaxID=2714931 RepID=UPI00140AB12F|nr:Fic family protein [Sanguibacter sp. HDW7]QIK84575.1 Fic family protein [Sanguibacter sp. HDW7]
MTDGGWPALAYEDRDWDISAAEGHLDAFQRRRFARPYRAAVVPHVARSTYTADPSTAELEAAATAEIVRFDAEMAALPTPMPAILLRTESASSSRIENLTAGARAVALAELDVSSSRNARLVAAGTRAMRAALADLDDVSATTILTAHRHLLEEDDPEIAGRFRTTQVWIGASSLSPHDADYVAPHAEHVPALVADLVGLAARRDLAPLAHTALVHAQLETIHPFEDGNGRTGRALVHTMLRARGLVRRASVPVSAGLLHDTVAYFDALDEYRQGRPDAIVAALSHATFGAAANGRVLAREITEMREAWRDALRVRADAAAWRLLDHVVEHPVVDAALVASALGVTDRGARNAIDALEEAGILTRFSAGRRRMWQAAAVLTAMDDFARRAGRRSAPR